MTKESLENKLHRLAKESERELYQIELFRDKIRDDLTYTINYRAKKRLGQCCNKKDINISSWLLEIGTDKDIKDTIIHEILHTFEDTHGHDYLWTWYADIVNSRLGYHISRLGSIDEIYQNAGKTTPIQRTHYKYEITCMKCGHKWNWQRLTRKGLDAFTSGKRYHQHCGGNDFRIVDLDNGEEIW